MKRGMQRLICRYMNEEVFFRVFFRWFVLGGMCDVVGDY